MTCALWLRIKLIVGLNLLLIAVYLMGLAWPGRLYQFGIIPGSVAHWFHVFTAPFIHGSVAHLTNNLAGFSLFSAFCLLRSVRFYLGSCLFIIVVGGALVWLFGRPATHIGASGLIFGLWSLTIALAWFDRRILNILLALLVIFLYGGMIYGLLPTNPYISFEAHIFGALAGVLCAYGYALTRKTK